MKYRKKPVVIEAVQWDGSNVDEVLAMATTVGVQKCKRGELLIDVPEGPIHVANQGDWIIKTIEGDLSTCEPDAFAAAYEPVEETDHA